MAIMSGIALQRLECLPHDNKNTLGLRWIGLSEGDGKV